jgi:putative heme degradation protein
MRGAMTYAIELRIHLVAFAAVFFISQASRGLGRCLFVYTQLGDHLFSLVSGTMSALVATAAISIISIACRR